MDGIKNAIFKTVKATCVISVMVKQILCVPVTLEGDLVDALMEGSLLIGIGTPLVSRSSG